MCVSHGGICNQKFILFQSPLCNCLRSFLIQHLLRSRKAVDFCHRNSREYRNVKLWFHALCFVYNFISYVIKDFPLSILCFSDVKQFRVCFDKSSVALSSSEGRMVQHIEQKSDVGFYAFDFRFSQRSDGFLRRSFKGSGISRGFNQKTVIIRRNYRTGKSVAAVQSDAVTGGTSVEFDGARIRCESVSRIFCGNSALNRVTCHLDVLLTSDTHFL